jgi:hypothetical protein
MFLDQKVLMKAGSGVATGKRVLEQPVFSLCVAWTTPNLK